MGESVVSIAERYGIMPQTVTRRIRDAKNSKHYPETESMASVTNHIPVTPELFQMRISFDLRIGDIVTAEESGLATRQQYKVVQIHPHVYILRKLKGHEWDIACQKKSYKRSYDPNKVKLVMTRREHEKQKNK